MTTWDEPEWGQERRRPPHRPHEPDIPGGAVAGFGFGLTAFILSSIAGLIVFGDLVGAKAERGLVDSAAPTIIGLAVPGLIGAGTAALSLANRHPSERLGRSLAYWGLIFAVLSWINLAGYAISLRQVERDLEALVEQNLDAGPTLDDGHSELPWFSDYATEDLPWGFDDPTPGRWITSDGNDCRWELVDLGGRVYDRSVGNEVFIDPAGVATLRTEYGCNWVMAG